MTGHTTGTLIIGGGEAALQTAAALRTSGYTDGITIAGEERHAPYQRPPLSKAFLAGEADEYSLQLRAEEFYTERGIELWTGTRIANVSVDDTGRGEAVSANGHVIRFDKLVLATGASPRRLSIPGGDAGGVVYIRDIDSARHLQSCLADARRVVIIGGGFIGLEAAAVARGRGLDVTIVETTDRLLKRVAAPPLSEFYRRAHEQRGCTVLTDTAVTEILTDGDDQVTGVRLALGGEMPADLVIVGVGVVPNTDLARQAGLACDRGILVDQAARTSNPGVVAAGDCTQQPHPLYPEELVCLESVQNAAVQGKIAAATLTGQPQPAPQVPWFWSDQGNLKLQIAGLATGYEKYVVRGNPDTESFSVLYYRDGRLIAADAVNAPHDFMAVKRALGKNATIDPHRASDTSVPLKTLLEELEITDRPAVPVG